MPLPVISILLNDLLTAILPRTCAACGVELKAWEECMCLRCMMGLPLTRFHLDPSNPLAESFWGRVRIEQSVAWFYFRKGSAYQEVLHKLKYNHRPDIGIWLGRQMGYELKNSPVFIRPDLILPVPLHKKKLRKRGYNQSEKIALGLSQGLGVTMNTRSLIRQTVTETQTRKSRFDRYLNVSGKFTVLQPESLSHKHLLIVDDVVTTGATLEACAEVLLALPGVRVSVAAIAWAKE